MAQPSSVFLVRAGVSQAPTDNLPEDQSAAAPSDKILGAVFGYLAPRTRRAVSVRVHRRRPGLYKLIARRAKLKRGRRFRKCTRRLLVRKRSAGSPTTLASRFCGGGGWASLSLLVIRRRLRRLPPLWRSRRITVR